MYGVDWQHPPTEETIRAAAHGFWFADVGNLGHELGDANHYWFRAEKRLWESYRECIR